MRFSLVLATFGRTDELDRFIKSLYEQTYKDFELIIVDQNEDDRLINILIPYKGVMDIKHLRSTPGLSKSRNLGLKYVSGDIICFPDDDCWYHTNLLSSVVSWFKANNNCDFLSGCYTEPSQINYLFKQTTTNLKVNSIFGRKQLFSSVTLFFKRELFDNGYIFDEYLGAGTNYPFGEETDLLFKLLKDGYHGIYDPQIIVFHKINRKHNEPFSRKLACEEVCAYLVAKHQFQFNLNGIYLLFLTILKPLFKSVFIFSSFRVILYRVKGIKRALMYK